MRKLQYYINQFKAEISYLSKNLGYFISTKKKAIYIGCIGHGNLGDEAVYFAIRELIKDRIYLYPISYAKPSSGKYLRRMLMKTPDFIILEGGTIIKKNKSESYLNLYNNYHNQFPEAKLIVFGSGVADPNLAELIGFPTDISNWKTILNKCSFVGVRGSLSQSVLHNDWKIVPEINILHDPALYFKRETLIKKNKQKKVGVNFCNIVGRIYGLDQKALEVFAVELVNKLLSEGWSIYLYPAAKSDIFYMKTILGEELVSRIQVYKNFTNLKGSLKFLESLDVFIGQRLHSVIFAAITYTPFYAIEYESKTSDFLQSLGAFGVSTRTDQLNVDEVMKNINELYLNLEINQNKLYELVNKASTQQGLVSQKLLKQV